MASALLDTAQVKEHVGTGLGDDALERLIDSADSYIRRMVGPHDPAGGETTLTFVKESPGYRISLPRQASAVTSVHVNHWYGNDVAIPSGSYRLESDGYAVEIVDYTIERDNDTVTIVYTPVPENDERTQALIELVRLELADTGLATERDDTYSYKSKDKVMARREIMAPLRHNHGGFSVLA